MAERRGLARFRAEQPPYSILTRAIEREVLPVCEQYGMGTLVWSPLAMGMLTGRYRKGQEHARQPARQVLPPADVGWAQPGRGEGYPPRSPRAPA